MTRQSTTTPGTRRFDELEAYRGLSAMLLIIFHSYQYSRAALQLPHYVYQGTALHEILIGLRLSGMFFCLSGFLLFLPFARAALDQGQRRSSRSFLLRRIIRILPLYYLVFLTVWALRYNGQPEQWPDLLLHLTFTQTFHAKYIFWTIGPSWSLAIEMQFYVFLACFGPLVYWLCRWLPGRPARSVGLGMLVAALGGASLAYRWWAFVIAGIPESNYPYYFGIVGKFDTLALGMLLAVVVAARGDRPLFNRPGSWLVLLLGLALLVASFVLKALSPIALLYYNSMIALAFLFIFSSTLLGPRGSWLERLLTWPQFQFIGSISYGLYLLHEPIMIELGKHNLLIRQAPEAFPVNALVLIGLSIGAATLSYRLVERPFNELRHLLDGKGRLVERYQETRNPARPPLAGEA